MRDLEDRPLHLVLLLSFVAGIFSILHLVGELEEGVLDVVEALWRGLTAFASASDCWHGCELNMRWLMCRLLC